jgi:hypothetical protein
MEGIEATVGGMERSDEERSRGISPLDALAGSVGFAGVGGALGALGIVAASFARSFNSCRI